MSLTSPYHPIKKSPALSLLPPNPSASAHTADGERDFEIDTGAPTCFVERPPDDLFCPICLDVLEDPVTALCGHTFCAQCIARWMAAESTCPVDRQPIESVSALVPNGALAARVGALTIWCQYGCRWDGAHCAWIPSPVEERTCHVTFPLAQRDLHEDSCPFREEESDDEKPGGEEELLFPLT